MTTCSSGNQKFLVSVGKAMAFDTTCAGKQLIFVADTLTNSTITQAVQSSQVYGGPGSRLLFEYSYQKEISVTLEDAAFSPTYLAIQNGTKLVDALHEVYTRETVKFDATGIANLKEIPNGEVSVALSDGTFTTVLPTGQIITLADLADKEAQVVYTTNKQSKKLTIDSTSFPSAMELVISVDIFDNNNKKVEEMQIVIPNFRPDGNFELALAHDGVATSSVTGKALDSCGKYAEINFIPHEDASDCEVTDIVVTPNPVQLEALTPADTQQLLVRQVFKDGSVGSPISTGVTFTSADDAVASVDANGLVTAGGAVVGGETTVITVSYIKETGALAVNKEVPVTIEA